MKKILLSIFTISTLFLVSCGGGNTEKETEEKQTAEAKTEEHNHKHEHPEAVAEAADFLPVPEGAKVFFANLEDGAVVTSPFTVDFGIEGMEVEPAGELNEGKGHHHIVINGGPIERGTVVPADETNIHFGKGQTSTELELEPGAYSLTMQFADGAHQSYGEQMAATIQITVE